MTKRAGVVLIIALCALSLTLHFAAESLGEIRILLESGDSARPFDMHEGDQFVMDGSGNDRSPRPDNTLPFYSKPSFLSRTLTPLLQPPKAG